MYCTLGIFNAHICITISHFSFPSTVWSEIMCSHFVLVPAPHYLLLLPRYNKKLGLTSTPCLVLLWALYPPFQCLAVYHYLCTCNSAPATPSVATTTTTTSAVHFATHYPLPTVCRYPHPPPSTISSPPFTSIRHRTTGTTAPSQFRCTNKEPGPGPRTTTPPPLLHRDVLVC